jgi:hypothetical protein
MNHRIGKDMQNQQYEGIRNSELQICKGKTATSSLSAAET